MTQEKPETKPRGRLIREGNEYHLQVYEIGDRGHDWKTVRRFYFPHLAREARGEYDEYDEDMRYE